MTLEDYSYLWRDQNAGWVLMADDSGVKEPLTSAIVNRLTKSALVIEDDELYRQVRKEMFKNGVPIVTLQEVFDS